MSTYHHPVKTTLAVALALGAIAPATASADLIQGDPPAYGPTPPAVQIARVSAPNSFDWADAGIGAAGGLGISALVVGGGLVMTQRRARSPRRSPQAAS
jgi:hypothetical protein